MACLPLNGRVPASPNNATDQPHYQVAWLPLCIGVAMFASVESVLTFAAGNLTVMLLTVLIAVVVAIVLIRLFRGRFAPPKVWFGGRQAATIGLGFLGSVLFIAAFIGGAYPLSWLRSGFLISGLPVPVAAVACWLIVAVIAVVYYRFVEALMNVLAARAVKQR